MPEQVKIKLLHLFLAGISIILLITVFLLGAASIYSVHELGNYTITKNKQFLNDEFATLITNNAENFANSFSSTFKEIFDCGYLLARNTEDLYNNEKINTTENEDEFDDIKYIEEPNLYVHVTSPPVSTLCYFGNNKNLIENME